MGGPSRRALAAAGASLALVAACMTNPATGERQFTLISEAQEAAMGKEAAAAVAETIGTYKDPQAEPYVAALGRQLAAKSERPKLEWTFQIVDDPVVNAFALPGGHIFVTRGLLTYLNSEAQLASVVGHEVGHVTARHAARLVSKQQVAELGLAVGMIFSETLRQYGQAGMAGLSLLFLKYGRDAEREADELGYRYTERGGFDVRAMPQVFATLKRVSEATGDQRLPTWLSTHPSPDERIARINELIAKTNPPAGKVAEKEYLRLTDGMVFGDDPRQGFFDKGVFKHPQLRFQVQIPPGWKAQNLAQAVVAQSPQGDAAFQLTLAKPAPPAEALRAFGGQQGITAFEPVPALLHGLDAASARFVAATEQGRLAGLVTFVAHGGKTYQLLGLAPEAAFAAAQPTLAQVEGSFAPLTDPAALEVQPARIKLVTVDQPMTLADLQQRHPSTIPLDQLAIVNQIDPQTRLQPGQLVKTVVGGRQAGPPVARR